MTELKLELKGDGVTLDTADAAEVLPILVAYLEAVRVVAISSANGDESTAPRFELPRWYSSSIGSGCGIRNNEDAARQATKVVHENLTTPWKLAPGANGAVANLRDHLRELPDGVSVVVNGLAERVDITAIARGINRPVAFGQETLRAYVVKAGGTRPASVRFRSVSDGAFTLRASAALAQLAGKLLYEPVDVEAEIYRALDLEGMPIMRGRALKILAVASGPTLSELREWYDRAFPDGVSLDEHDH
jgi:hypothetical protein